MAISTAMCSSFKQESWKGRTVFTTTGFTLATPTAVSTVTYTGLTAGTGTIRDVIPGMSFTGTNVGASSFVANIISSSSFTSSVASSGTVSGNLTFTNPHATSIKLALFTSASTIGAATTVYAATAEASGVTAGGYALTFSASMPGLTTTVAWMDFADLVISAVTTTAAGCLIYDSYAGLNYAISTHDFGGDKTSTAGDFTVVFPVADSSTGILRLA